MSADIFEKARARIAYHEAEVRRLKAFIATAEELLDAPPVGGGMVTIGGGLLTIGGNQVTAAATDITPTNVVLSESATILSQAGKPMSASDLYEKVVRRGVKIAGKNPKGNLTAKFATRRDVFSFDKDTGLWSLAAWGGGKNNEASTGTPEDASKVTGDERQTSLLNTESGDD